MTAPSLPAWDDRAVLAGVDSGGTSTSIIAADAEGERCPFPRTRGSLSGLRSDGELRDIMTEVFTLIARSSPARQKAYIWISCAGYADSTRDRFLRLMSQADPGFRAGLVGISNDSAALVLAHEPGTVIVIAGTGSEIIARTPDRGLISIGGDEWVAADHGSAFWIGMHGIRAAYQALTGGSGSVLLDALVAHYGQGGDHGRGGKPASARAIVRFLAEQDPRPKTAIASFAPCVTLHAEQGDTVARRIVRRSAEDLADLAAGAYRGLAAGAQAVPPSFILSGSVGWRSPLYAQIFRAALDERLFDVQRRLGTDISLRLQPDGSQEALRLAERLMRGSIGTDHGDGHELFSVLQIPWPAPTEKRANGTGRP